MIKCPNCGAQLKFNVKQQLVTCEYCKSKFDPKELKEEVKVSEEVKETYEGKAYLCSQCGAKLLTFDDTAITFCSYCGSQAMLEERMMKQNSPEYIIPFAKSKEECIDEYKKKLSKAIFAPKYMKSDVIISKFRGIYIPYAIYKLSHHGPCSNKGSRYSHRSGDYKYYNDYLVTADIDADYDGISYDLSSNFYDKFSHAIPHNFKKAEKFNPNYLTGFYADAMDVDKTIYSSDAKTVASLDSSNYLRKRREFSRYGCSNPKADFDVSDVKVGMFPIYFLAIRDKSNTYVNYAVINGQTGKVVIDLPVDFKKYILIAFLIAIPIFLLINDVLVFTPKKICVYSIIFSVISLIISLSQSKKIKLRQNHLDDIGYKVKNSISEEVVGKKKNKEKLGKKISSKYKQILGIVIGIIVLLANFVNDIYYYSASVIMYTLVILSFYDLIKQHNLLVSTKLPQLEKRGGDERE